MNPNVKGLITIGVFIGLLIGLGWVINHFFGSYSGCIKMKADGSVHCDCEFKSDDEWNKFKDNTEGLNHDGWEAVVFPTGYDPCKVIKDAYKTNSSLTNDEPTSQDLSQNQSTQQPTLIQDSTKIDSNKETNYSHKKDSTPESLDYNHQQIADYDQAIKYDTTYYFNYERRGNFKFDVEDYQGAISDFTKVIELQPNQDEGYVERGYAKFRLKDYKGAIADYDKAIEISPNDHNGQNNTYFFRGNAKCNLQDYQGAIDDYSVALIYHQYDTPYFNRAVAKHQIGDKDGACLDWKKALEFGNKDAQDMINKFCN